MSRSPHRWPLGRSRSKDVAAPAAEEPASFELQIHSGGRQGRVHYLRLNRSHLTLASALALLYVFFLAFAAGMAPGVVGALLGGEEYRVLAAQRARQGERLQSLVARLEELRTRSEGSLLRVRKVSSAYDLPPAVGPATPSPTAASPPLTAATPATPATPPMTAEMSAMTLAGGGAAGATAATGDAAAVDGADLESPPAGSIYAGAVQQGERLRARIRAQIGAMEAGLTAIQQFESAHPDLVSDTPATCPLRGDRYVLTNAFGRQRSAFTRDLAFHAGIDLAAPRGTPILTPADGVVVFAGTYPLGRSPVWWRYGNLVVVAHGERFLTLYGHCAELKVAAGKRVRRGEQLATVGSSGWSLSPHLHYEVRKRGAGGELVPVDPLIYVLDRRWPNEQRLLAQTRAPAPVRDYEPLPAGLERPGSATDTGRGRRRRR